MTRVSDIIFCFKADSLPGKGMCANGIITTINPECVPGPFRFSVIVTFLGLDTSKPHRLTVRLFSETEVIANVDNMMPVSIDRTDLPDDYKGFNLKMDWNKVQFKSNGEHTLTIAVDGVLLGEKKIYVQGKNH